MLYKVYVLYSPSHQKLYAGITTGLGEYMQQLNGGQSEDKMATFRPWTLIHMELFHNEGEASFRESYLLSPQGQAYIRSDILSLFDFAK